MTTHNTYAARSYDVEAIQLVGSDSELHRIYLWIESNTAGSYDHEAVRDRYNPAPVPESGVTIDPADGCMVIMTPWGEMKSKPGDYVVRNAQGVVFPMEADVFAALYEPTEESPTLASALTAAFDAEREGA